MLETRKQGVESHAYLPERVLLSERSAHSQIAVSGLHERIEDLLNALV
jgi:hypothetical protein